MSKNNSRHGSVVKSSQPSNSKANVVPKEKLNAFVNEVHLQISKMIKHELQGTNMNARTPRSPHQSSVVYDVARDLPPYEKNQAWAHSREQRLR